MHARLLALPLLATPLCIATPPDTPDTQPTLLCWPESARPGVLDFEKQLLNLASPDQLRKWHDLLASEPHVAGTPGDLREIDRLANAFTKMGLEVDKHEFWPLLCRPTSLSLEVVSPEHVTLFTKENILKEDPYCANPDLTPGWNAYSGSGDVTAEVIYANYGTKEDFKKLAELGIDCTGKIILARYGGNYRGYKAKFAQAAGAAGLIIYTDPADSGYCKGLLYPEGGYANDSCIQRGSILTLDYPGDPLTPGAEATKDAQRLDAATVALPKIPVTPIGYGSAQQIIGRMKGPSVPEKWQGGLPFPYRLTGGPDLKVRLQVQQERFVGKTANVIAKLTGATEPDKLVIIGCHHDAWGFGAADPLCGTIVLMETARVLSEAAKQGHRPARTILFCAWGAEEFGIIGSTEWVEAHAQELTASAVSYINLDMASMGTDFGSSATPSMQQVIADVAHLVPQPKSRTPQAPPVPFAPRTTATTQDSAPSTQDSSAPKTQDSAPGAQDSSVFAAWLARAPDPLDKSRPKFGDLGGGSDHEAFVCHTGVAAASLGAGGAPGNSYHSTYDNLQWYRQTVGDDYDSALMITRLTTLAVHRLACAPVIPLDPSRYAVEVTRAIDTLVKHADELKWPLVAPAAAPADAREVDSMLVNIRAKRVADLRTMAGTRLALLKDAVATRPARWSADHAWTAENIRVWNASVLHADRAWLDTGGLPARPWFRNLFIATDEDSGYASWPLPGLRRAVECKDDEALGTAVESIGGALERMME